MTNSTDMFKILDYFLDGGSILVEYNRVEYFLDNGIESLTKGVWKHKDGGIVDEELQEILHYVLERHELNPPNATEYESMRKIAEELWSLLDSIDTLSDICKPTINSPNLCMAFYNNAMKYAGKRFDLLKSDGYKLYTKEEFDKLDKSDESSYSLKQHFKI